jgi:hypothetical protein
MEVTRGGGRRGEEGAVAAWHGAPRTEEILGERNMINLLLDPRGDKKMFPT